MEYIAKWRKNGWKNMEQTKSYRIEKIIILVTLVLLLLTLGVAFCTRNTVEKTRGEAGYQVIADLQFRTVKDGKAPIGIAREGRFVLKDMGRGNVLVFYINHHAVEMYVEGDCIYRMTTTDRAFKTPGGVWVRVPLYPEDIGKEITIRLLPVYDDYQKEEPEVMVGPEMAIYRNIFYGTLPELFLGVFVILAGVFLLCFAFYYRLKKTPAYRLYAVGALAIAAGLWRLTYDSFCYLVCAENPVLVYNLSIVSLMLVAIAMLNVTETSKNGKLRKGIRVGTILYSLLYCTQMILQLAGVLDLRQMLKITHGTIILSAFVLFINGIRSWFAHPIKGNLLIRNYSWILAIGAVGDLVLYYFRELDFGMMMTLSSILVFTILEGVKLLISYTEQKNALKEMETQLVLSRTTTMMSQIRSHFVFNLLNAISGMCKYDPEKADETVVRFARYLRNNIDIMENDRNIPFATDLKQLEDYVALEQVRFGDKITFYTDIEEDQFFIPPLILQPLVENAIKHGISKKETDGIIVLRTKRVEDEIVITVEDDGVGFAMDELEKEQSVGIKNIRFRLQHLVDGTLELDSCIGKGTTATVRMPIKEDEICM